MPEVTNTSAAATDVGEFITDLDGGSFDRKLSIALSQVAAATIDHDKTGIGLVPFLEEDPNDDMPTEDEWDIDCATQKEQPPAEVEGSLLWDSQENRVIGNVLSDNRAGDLAVASAGGDISTFDNCWASNEFTTSAPTDIETLAPCDQPVATTGWDVGTLNVALWLVEAETRPKAQPYDQPSSLEQTSPVSRVKVPLPLFRNS